ncbi:unnamed protein product [Nippostrongylus brasiliensis]|uniref:Uncharacterized protein n=1 Tax=Nippostrongylus brasiliensis TaxID=27835 RepID=A0A0N4YGS9_NIPBR|nr:unnamed protein product [Nippostrongylus brasiliensis]
MCPPAIEAMSPDSTVRRVRNADAVGRLRARSNYYLWFGGQVHAKEQIRLLYCRQTVFDDISQRCLDFGLLILVQVSLGGSLFIWTVRGVQLQLRIIGEVKEDESFAQAVKGYSHDTPIAVGTATSVKIPHCVAIRRKLKLGGLPFGCDC